MLKTIIGPVASLLSLGGTTLGVPVLGFRWRGRVVLGEVGEVRDVHGRERGGRRCGTRRPGCRRPGSSRITTA